MSRCLPAPFLLGLLLTPVTPAVPAGAQGVPSVTRISFEETSETSKSGDLWLTVDPLKVEISVNQGGVAQ